MKNSIYFCFSITGAMGICFPYLGEFQPTKYREKILCWMEIFWTLGVIALPLIAWVIIPLKMPFDDSKFLFHSWNLFVAICALPSLFLGLWLFTFPESPKFLIEVGDADDALDVLKTMYHYNTGNPREDYPIKSLKEKEKGETNNNQSLRSLSIRKPKHLKILLREVWEQTKALCRPPHLANTVLTCAVQFGLTASYYTLMIWFPEVFYRFKEFEDKYPDDPASVCKVSSILLNEGKDPFCSGEAISDEVYLHTVIIGLACIPTSLILPACIHRLGAKFFIIFSMFIAGAVTFGFYFVQDSNQNLILSCIFEALTSLGISTVYCVMVDLFPTNLRVMAAALSLTFGRGKRQIQFPFPQL
jgi:MFS transporter, VNT family, synaptic vesicle glycoprotein 2